MNISSDRNGTIRFDRAVPIGDDTFLEYGTVDAAAVDTVEAIVDQHPAAEEVTVSEQRVGDKVQFELRVSEPPIISTVASHGGYMQQMRIEDGDLYLTIPLPTTVAASQIIDVVRETYPTATLQTRRQIARDEETFSEVYQTYTEALTERQRSVLETAVYSGYFEWPRKASGKDLADTLGVSPPTFHQHLRLAQKKVFESLVLAPSS
jgi:predicted DNA binding protein